MKRLIAAAAVAGVLVIFWPAAPAGAACPMPTFNYKYKHGTVEFTEHGETTRVRVEIADAQAAREFGLMCRTSMAPDAGMLFEFASIGQDPFWMRDTLIPLSIAFFDFRWHIVALLDMAVAPDPSTTNTTYASPKPYLYALEVNQGFFVQHGIDAAAVVSFVPEAPPGR